MRTISTCVPDVSRNAYRAPLDSGGRIGPTFWRAVLPRSPNPGHVHFAFVLPPDDFLRRSVFSGFQMFSRQYTTLVAAVAARRDGCTDECEEQHGRRRNGHTARIACIGRINTQSPSPPPLRAGNKSQTSKCNSTIALLGPIRARARALHERPCPPTRPPTFHC